MRKLKRRRKRRREKATKKADKADKAGAAHDEEHEDEAEGADTLQVRSSAGAGVWLPASGLAGRKHPWARWRVAAMGASACIAPCVSQMRNAQCGETCLGVRVH